MLVTITSGAHWRNVNIPEGECQFAHNFDPDSPEDIPHEALNFITYANSLGWSNPNVVLISPQATDDEQEWQHILVMMSDWKSLVETATGRKVEIR